MTNQDEPLVVARFKADKLTFTPVVGFRELFDAANEKLPLDIVYIIQEGPDGYSLKQAGIFTVTFHSLGELPIPPEPPRSVLASEISNLELNGSNPSSKPDLKAIEDAFAAESIKPPDSKILDGAIPMGQPPKKRGPKPKAGKIASIPVNTARVQAGAVVTGSFTPAQPKDEDKFSDVQGFD